MITHSFTPHAFHIPVMGLGYTLDTPLKVAKYGISSVVSIIEDQLMEQMREKICLEEGIEFKRIHEGDKGHRSHRIKAYLDLLNDIVRKQMKEMQAKDIANDADTIKYFRMLDKKNPARRLFDSLEHCPTEEKKKVYDKLREYLVPGSIDVNIMTKVDRAHPEFGPDEERKNSDASAALRGFATSSLNSAVVFSAGMNPRLYSYCSEFEDFFPDEKGSIKKKIILKVSDYRSALVQGKYLAKKGLWVSEFRIESGINCGGHAFISNGVLIGPILEEFKNKRVELFEELKASCNDALRRAEKNLLPESPVFRITAQGGVGTSLEQTFLLKHYELDSIGWGSPFLLVPEATSVDEQTLQQLATAKKQDYYLSHASPLGIPFHSFRPSSSEKQRNDRILKGRPGSPCYKKFLSTNTEFTKEPICTASRQYQKLKIAQVTANNPKGPGLTKKIEEIVEKDCLCEGLGASALIKNKLKPSHKLTAVSICPGPNLAYFSGTFTLKQMVDHIYGRKDVLKNVKRSVCFVNELQLYFDYFIKEVEKNVAGLSERGADFFQAFRQNLLAGIDYYERLLPGFIPDQSFLESNLRHLTKIKTTLQHLSVVAE